jgi:2-phospho-L-lactate guanylyltransferase
MSPGWDVVVPVREWGHAKSRLRHLAPASRVALARALAEDTIDTVRATRDVRTCWVVGSATTCSEIRSRGARTIQVPDALGLREALRSGVAAVVRSGDGAAAIAVLVADLPMLTPEALGKALRSVPDQRGAFIRDAAGSGTVLLAGRTVDIEPAFGPDSANKHLALGAIDITGESDDALRHDLDTREDLEAVSPRPGSRVAAWYWNYGWTTLPGRPPGLSTWPSTYGSTSTIGSTRSSCSAARGCPR